LEKKKTNNYTFLKILQGKEGRREGEAPRCYENKGGRSIAMVKSYQYKKNNKKELVDKKCFK
jgi:hypothetical protein